MNNKLREQLINTPAGHTIKIGDYIFQIEVNETGCFRAICDHKATDEDKAFFISRNTALEAYIAALSVQDYNANIISNIEKVRLELLQFITKKKKELGLENTDLDFDGNVYFIQISHGLQCKNHQA
jgi:hypothetical protein